MPFSILLILFIMNTDAFCTGVIYSIKKIKISFLCKVLMSACSTFYSYISILFGKELSKFLPEFFTQAIGFSILFLLGSFMVIKGIRSSMNSDKFDFDKSMKIDPLEAVCLGLALSVDCLSVGIGLSLMGINSAFLPPLMGIFQFIFLSGGIQLGKGILGKKSVGEKALNIISGLLLILLAVLQFVL